MTLAYVADGLRRELDLASGSGPLSSTEAVDAGHHLADHPALDLAWRRGLTEFLSEAAAFLSQWSVHLDVVRRRPGCTIVRAWSDPDSGIPGGLLVKGLLEALTSPSRARGTILIENQASGDRSLTGLFTLVGDSTPPAADGGPATLEVEGSITSATADFVDAPRIAAPTTAEPETFHAQDELTVPLFEPDPEDAEPESQATDRAEAPGQLVPVAPATIQPLEAPRDRSARVLSPDAPERPGAGRRNRLAWVRRRAWILLLTVVAGAAGGHFMAAHRPTSYSADATLVVQSGAGVSGPGDANDAAALAITYATFIPSDGAVLRTAARSLGTSESAVGSSLSMSVETGTSVIELTYSAATPAAAVAGATAVANTVSRATPPESAVPEGSIRAVHLPTSARPTDNLEKYAVPLGAILGLLVGLVVVLAAERADPRLDDEHSLADVTNCPVTTVPGAVSVVELAQAIALRRDTSGPVTLVPLSHADQSAALLLADHLQTSWPSRRVSHGGRGSNGAGTRIGEAGIGAPRFEVAADLTSGAVDHGSGSTVVVVQSGSPRRLVASGLERLGLAGRDPIWAILTVPTRRWRQATSAR